MTENGQTDMIDSGEMSSFLQPGTIGTLLCRSIIHLSAPGKPVYYDQSLSLKNKINVMPTANRNNSMLQGYLRELELEIY